MTASHCLKSHHWQLSQRRWESVKKSCGSFLPLQTHLDNKGVVFFQAVVVVVRVASAVVLVHVGDAVVEQVRALLLVVRPPCVLPITFHMIPIFY